MCEDTSQTWVHWDDTEKGMGAWASLLARPNWLTLAVLRLEASLSGKILFYFHLNEMEEI